LEGRGAYNHDMRRRAGSVKVILLVIAGAVVVVTLLGLGAKAVFQEMVKELSQDQADKRSMGKVVDAAEKMAKGEKVDPIKGFPDTPVGHMNKLLYQTVQDSHELEGKIDKELKDIGWDWVMSNDSLKSKANLEECLNRIGRAEKLVTRYSDRFEHIWNDALVAMQVEADKSNSAAAYLAGVKEGLDQPDGGRSFIREFIRLLRANHQGLKEAIQFLLAHPKDYQMGPEGPVFLDTVPQSEVDKYNALTDRANEAMKKIDEMNAASDKSDAKDIQSMRDALK